MKRRKLQNRNLRTSTIYIRKFPRDLKNHFKAYCVRRDISMADQVEILIRELLREEFRKMGRKPTDRRTKTGRTYNEI